VFTTCGENAPSVLILIGGAAIATSAKKSAFSEEEKLGQKGEEKGEKSN